MTSYKEVTLTISEMIMAAQIGVTRQLAAIKAGKSHRYGYEGIGWDTHIEGACGELATCKVKDWFFPGCVNTFKTLADIGGWIEVRTRSNDEYDLIVRQDDDPDKFYVLVTGKSPTYRVHGFIDGVSARNPAWLRTYGNRPSAFFVPQEHLTSIDVLQNNISPSSLVKAA